MGFFPGIFESILSMYPHSYCLYGVLLAYSVARSGDMSLYLGAREAGGGKQAMKAVAKAAPPVNYLAHL